MVAGKATIRAAGEQECLYIGFYSLIQMDSWERVSAGSPGSGSKFLGVFLHPWSGVARRSVDRPLLTLREAAGEELGESGSRSDLAPRDPLQGQGMALSAWTVPTKQQYEGHRIR